MGLVDTFIEKQSDLKKYALYLTDYHTQDAEDMMQDTFLKIHRTDQRGKTFEHKRQEYKYIVAALQSVNIDRLRGIHGRVDDSDKKAQIVRISTEELYLFLICQGGGRKDEVEPDMTLDEQHEQITHEFRRELCIELLRGYYPHILKTFEDRINGKTFKTIVKETGRGLNTILGEYRYAKLFLEQKLDAIKQQTGGPIFEPVRT